MPISVTQIVRLGKQAKIEELNNLSHATEFVEAIGKLIHALQAERGASSIFLASQGGQFQDKRQVLAMESEVIERELRAIIKAQLDRPSFSKAKYFHYIAWVLIGLDGLPVLRNRILEFDLTPNECIVAFSRLIASLISVIFEVADSAIDPRISSLLVALFNLVQGKEFAGQERAIGALSFASGTCETSHRTRLNYLIDAQERHFSICEEFAGQELAKKWRDISSTGNIAEMESLRQKLSGGEGNWVEELSNKWFEICSERLSSIWKLQCSLVKTLKEQCRLLVAESQSELQDSEGLLKMLYASPPAISELASGFYDPAIPLENILRFEFLAGREVFQEGSLLDTFHAQSERLTSMEAELAAARRALDERKTIERAKGVLMAHFKLSEDEAYKRMRTTSMEQNKRLIEVAEAVLTLMSLS